jgi:hypothetical protein
MTAHHPSAYLEEKAGAGRLLVRGLAAGVLAVTANSLVYLLAPALFGVTLAIPVMGPGSPIQPLPFSMVVFATAVPTLGATIVLAALNRFTARPAFTFRIIAGVLLLLSLAAPFSLPVPLPVRATLASMHILTAAVIIFVLTAPRK